MGLISWIILGLICGTIAKAIIGGRAGWISSLIIGVVGGLGGGWLGSLLFHRPLSGFFSPWTWLLSVVGSCLVLWVYNKVSSRS
ncbi:GlsB/YeaQ/YmgE family stress response membrane protein [Propionibacterium freudenreichii]|uniref:GlsB/YeaQ/YmgE family stress response membrane protein n=1 Tax=Propionibacterium freudenreichii TaxID=1744 RepID=UPI000542ABB9|nr:GlsB/YeaQ/YmgE family stress response membrane protein [Propionibacterium freudenreichii]MDK9301213.1 GlsB/YeaQ/YmgE family stress response membrane protein [Propionibacterium freudenreichii]MDK9321374.1 GlsB/YeaQ/YmgE family stress response membrane protein [Propionibacterium freudenreichii]MDK9323929.1 GlsB/YeaQ/YmgE family stress response membrane protein [Propionibacterium freudenreichii]MDK9331598.1 GlsB/YeaQ/YmgE family stress response membrane protein [Propionibacterium freudenreichii